MTDLLSYVTMCLTLVVYVEPMSNASTHINYPHLYEELVIFVLGVNPTGPQGVGGAQRFTYPQGGTLSPTFPFKVGALTRHIVNWRGL